MRYMTDTTEGCIDKYIENPKTKGSGIICAIPQKGRCPNECVDCFFQSGRSYLEPLEDNLPNMPSDRKAIDRLLRVNDGNDSNMNKGWVIKATENYFWKFYNTSIPDLNFDSPVVLTLNPGWMTDEQFFHLKDPMPKNLMFVRIRTNTWNLKKVVVPAVKYYTIREIPVVLTFMAYFTTPIPEDYKEDYVFRKRTLNSYNAITTEAWERVMNLFKYNKWVHSCGKIEGEKGDTHCRFCGNCLREYFATMERLKNG